MSIVAKRLDSSRCQLVWKYRPRPRPHCVRWGPSSLHPKGGTPIFGPYVYFGQTVAHLSYCWAIVDRADWFWLLSA